MDHSEQLQKHPWDNIDIPKNYRVSEKGVFKLSGDNDIAISAPIWISAFTQDEYSNTDGVVVEYVDRRNKQRKLSFPVGIFQEPAKAFVQILSSHGLRVYPEKERQLSNYLASFDPNILPWIKSASQVGWINTQNTKLAYLFPYDGGQVIPKTHSEKIIFQPEQNSPTVETMFSEGTLDLWKTNIAAFCRGNDYLIFGIITSFATILLKFSQLESGGIHFYGTTSRGKTTLLQVAASVFGCGADPTTHPKHSSIQKWHSTVNAFEALAAAHNDGLLLLDDIGTFDGTGFGEHVYNLMGGRGKKRLNKSAKLQSTRTWNIFVMSTGEKSINARIQEEHKKAYGGQLLRFLDIVADDIISDTHHMKAADYVDKLKENCSHDFGSASQAFVEALANKFENTSEATYKIKQDLKRCTDLLTPKDAQPEQRRAIRRFALIMVAGHLACELRIIPYTACETDNAVITIVNAWLAENHNLPGYLLGIQALQSFIQRNPARFGRTESENPTSHDLVGLSKPNLFLFYKDCFTEVIGGQDPAEVRRELVKRDLILIDQHDRHLSKHMVYKNGKKTRQSFYAVKDEILELDISVQTSNIDGTGGTNGTSV